MTSEIMATFRPKSLLNDGLFVFTSGLQSKPTKITSFSFSTTHSSCGIAKVNLEAPHGSDNGDDRLDGVAVDHGLVLLTFLF